MIYYSKTFFDRQLFVAQREQGICYIGFEKPQGHEQESALISTAFEQLKEYFEGKRQALDFELFLDCTDFQRKVYECAKSIAYGHTISYKQLAEQLHTRAYRAVGRALKSNKLLFAIPCHRVIATSGKLQGFAGGLELKKWLLELEKK